jgi:hypothetical protein
MAVPLRIVATSETSEGVVASTEETIIVAKATGTDSIDAQTCALKISGKQEVLGIVTSFDPLQVIGKQDIQKIVIGIPQTGARGPSDFLVCNEILTGTIDGANKTFTTVFQFIDGTEKTHFNGVRQAVGVGCDYVTDESGGSGTGFDSIVFDVAPRTGDILMIDYTRVSP